MFIAKIIGGLGLLFITIATFITSGQKRSLILAIGGIFLLYYSVRINDILFIVLQIIFILSNIFNMYRIRKKI